MKGKSAEERNQQQHTKPYINWYKKIIKKLLYSRLEHLESIDNNDKELGLVVSTKLGNTDALKYT